MNPTATIQVTETRVFPNPTEDERLKAFATVTLNGCFVVTDMKVINGNEGLFVAMPARRRKDGIFHDVAHPITQELCEHIEQAVLDAYWQQVPGSYLPNPTRRSSHDRDPRRFIRDA